MGVCVRLHEFDAHTVTDLPLPHTHTQEKVCEMPVSIIDVSELEVLLPHYPASFLYRLVCNTSYR